MSSTKGTYPELDNPWSDEVPTVPNVQEASARETLKRPASRSVGRPTNKRSREEEGAALPSSCRCSDPGKNEEHTIEGSGTIDAKLGTEPRKEREYTERTLQVTQVTKNENDFTELRKQYEDVFSYFNKVLNDATPESDTSSDYSVHDKLFYKIDELHWITLLDLIEREKKLHQASKIESEEEKQKETNDIGESKGKSVNGDVRDKIGAASSGIAFTNERSDNPPALTLSKPRRSAFILPRPEPGRQKETKKVGESKGKSVYGGLGDNGGFIPRSTLVSKDKNTGGFCKPSYNTRGPKGKEIEKISKTPRKDENDISDFVSDFSPLQGSSDPLPLFDYFFDSNEGAKRTIGFYETDLDSMKDGQCLSNVAIDVLSHWILKTRVTEEISQKTVLMHVPFRWTDSKKMIMTFPASSTKELTLDIFSKDYIVFLYNPLSTQWILIVVYKPQWSIGDEGAKDNLDHEEGTSQSSDIDCYIEDIPKERGEEEIVSTLLIFDPSRADWTAGEEHHSIYLNVKQYLFQKASEKYPNLVCSLNDINLCMESVEIPFSLHYYDSGIYSLHFLDLFLDHPERFVNMPVLPDWQHDEAKVFRRQMLKQMRDLAEEFKECKSANADSR